jgi:D-glycero-alpha-D-manno-heptose 1-phosphate guanylyltransferase
MIKEAILLAGGLGTRLKKTVPDLPKPMAPVNGRPFIEYVLDYLIKNDVRKFILSVGYKHEAFASHFANDYKGCQVLFSVENEPLGTGGGIKKALEYVESPEVLILNADTFFKFDIYGFYQSHKKTNADLTIALRQMKDIGRYGSVDVDEEMRVTGFSEKSNTSKSGYINGGVYLIKKDIFSVLGLPEKFSMEKDFLEVYYNTLKICGFPSRGYFLDIGIPEDYEKAQHDLKEN